jgi:hypothetical protein
VQAGPLLVPPELLTPGRRAQAFLEKPVPESSASVRLPSINW